MYNYGLIYPPDPPEGYFEKFDALVEQYGYPEGEPFDSYVSILFKSIEDVPEPQVCEFVPKKRKYGSRKEYCQSHNFHTQLRKLRGVETVDIDDETIERIVATGLPVNEAIRSLGLKSLYGSHVAINKIINDVDPVPIGVGLQERLRDIFDRVLQAFYSIDTNRKNMIGYQYAIYKILQSIDMVHLARDVILPSKASIARYEKVWKEICDTLGWEFISIERDHIPQRRPSTRRRRTRSPSS